MNTRHKHADVIIAWANGAAVQWRPRGRSNWTDEPKGGYTLTFHNDDRYEYRIKPEPVPDQVFFDVVRLSDGCYPGTTPRTAEALKAGWSESKQPHCIVKVTIKTDENGKETKTVEIV